MIISILFFFIFWSIPWYFPFGIDPESRPWRPYLTMSQRVTTIFAFCCIFSDFLHVVWSISLFGHGPWTLKPWVQTVTTISIFFWFFLIFWILFERFPYLEGGRIFLIWKSALDPENPAQRRGQQWATPQAHHRNQQAPYSPPFHCRGQWWTTALVDNYPLWYIAVVGN